MTFEFIIACRTLSVTDIRQGLTDLLARVLQDNLNEFDMDVIDQMIQFRHARDGEQLTDDSGATTLHILIGFTLELPEETTSAKAVVQEFASELPDTPPIFHAVKFEDPLLQAELAERAKEIFVLEMKLRRVLSFIYLYAKQDSSPYALLRDDSVQPMGNPDQEQMIAASENQFFHLNFSQYINLNKRPQPKLTDILAVISDSEQYAAFRTEIHRTPIEQEGDVGLLAGLKERMDAVEQMRNCVAHNRRPSTRLIENYNNTLSQLHEMLDNYLSQIEPDFNEEMPWDTDAGKAVESALENALWDNDAKTITLYDSHDDRIYKTVVSLEELEEYLRQVARSAFYGSVPYEDAEPVFECDEYGIVESVLWDYEDRLDGFFDGIDENV